MNKLKYSSQSSIAYINVKSSKAGIWNSKHNKPKQERSFEVVLKYIYSSSNIDDIRKEIDDHRHIVTNIWNIKKQGSKAFLMFYIKLKSENNNKDANEIKFAK